MTNPIDELIEKLPTGFSEGPWHIVPYGDGDSLVIHYDTDNRVCFMATPGSRGDMRRIQANAQLIALAPEMASALSTLLEQKRKLEEALASIVCFDRPEPWRGLTDCVDNEGKPYQSSSLAGALISASALLSGGGEG